MIEPAGLPTRRPAESVAARLQRADFHPPTLQVCRALLGQCLVRLEPDGSRTGGPIIEAEAYIGQDDLGCHARSGRTTRNQVMWGAPGHAYVYFTYGMHWMLNLVTEAVGQPAAVLLRSLWPQEGLERMRLRRIGRQDLRLADGPAKLCQALGLDGSWDGHDICARRSSLFVERRPAVPERYVTKSPRVGLYTVPEPWKSIPWRFRVSRDYWKHFAKEEPVHGSA